MSLGLEVPCSMMTLQGTSTNASLFNLQKLENDGSNWYIWKDQALTGFGARILMKHIDGRAKMPEEMWWNPSEDSWLWQDTKRSPAPTTAESDAFET